MKATCPRNPNHKEFRANATIREEWIVDENGYFLKIGDTQAGQLMDAPSMSEEWTCAICGEVAVFE